MAIADCNTVHPVNAGNLHPRSMGGASVGVLLACVLSRGFNRPANRVKKSCAGGAGGCQGVPEGARGWRGVGGGDGSASGASGALHFLRHGWTNSWVRSMFWLPTGSPEGSGADRPLNGCDLPRWPVPPVVAPRRGTSQRGSQHRLLPYEVLYGQLRTTNGSPLSLNSHTQPKQRARTRHATVTLTLTQPLTLTLYRRSPYLPWTHLI